MLAHRLLGAGCGESRTSGFEGEVHHSNVDIDSNKSSGYREVIADFTFLEEAIARQEHLNQQADPESTLKLKTKGKGQSQYEPKLETKKYRRLSRRTQQQALQQLYQDAEE